MANKFNPVPDVDPEHIIQAHRKVVADREEYGSSDVMVSVVSLFAREKKMEPNYVLNISHRLFALANFLQSGEAKEWLLKETGEDYILVNEAVLRAAAVAPLMEAEYIKDMTFDRATFMPLVLQNAEAEGKA